MKKLLTIATAALVALAFGFTPAEAGQKKKKAQDPEANFKKLDTNNDGKLSKEEFAKVTELIAKKPKKAPPVDETFAKLDADKDGSLTLAEFKKISEVVQKKKKQNK